MLLQQVQSVSLKGSAELIQQVTVVSFTIVIMKVKFEQHIEFCLLS